MELNYQNNDKEALKSNMTELLEHQKQEDITISTSTKLAYQKATEMLLANEPLLKTLEEIYTTSPSPNPQNTTRQNIEAFKESQRKQGIKEKLSSNTFKISPNILKDNTR